MVTDDIDYVSLTNVNWNTKSYNDIVSNLQYANGTNIYYKVDPNIKELADENMYIFNAKANNISLLPTDNFVIEFNAIAAYSGATTNKTFLGLSDNPNTNNTNDFLVPITVSGSSTTNTLWTILGASVTQVPGLLIEFKLIKIGNSVSIVYKTTNHNGNIFGVGTTIISTNKPLFFGAIFTNRRAINSELNINLLRIYKF